MILPIEYFTNKSNVSCVASIVGNLQNCNKNIADIMFTLATRCFQIVEATESGFLDTDNVQQFLNEYANRAYLDELDKIILPRGERDLLGLLYQSFHFEGDKNNRGLYYTPSSIVKEITAGVVLQKDDTLLDPCCGSGSFLLNTDSPGLDQLFGLDIDPVAVMICKANLLMKYPNSNHYPSIYCADYLAKPSLFDTQKVQEIKEGKFSFITTNPPWGANKNPPPRSNHTYYPNETFASFLTAALSSLKTNGKLVFLLPESVLNVKAYAQLRKLILDNFSIRRIRLFPNLFTGVVTSFIVLEIRNRAPSSIVTIITKDDKYKSDISSFYTSPNYVFSIVGSRDKEIIKAFRKEGRYTLTDSTWALGIVTGNNAVKVLNGMRKGAEPIYTGKEIKPYSLAPPKKYIVYDRSQFQQVAKDEIYRAREKLVYKFISNRLVFAYDNSKSLFLNSANIVIPAIPSMSIKTVLLFLNSELFQYTYIKLFGEIKILKGNLCELSFPELSERENETACTIVNDILAGGVGAVDAAQSFVYKHYGVERSDIEYIRKVLANGKTYQ